MCYKMSVVGWKEKLTSFSTYNIHLNVLNHYSSWWEQVICQLPFYVVDGISTIDKKKKLMQEVFSVSFSLSVSVDIRMSKAVEEDKMGTELPVDSTGKNQYYQWLLKVCVSLNALRCSRNVCYVYYL